MTFASVFLLVPILSPATAEQVAQEIPPDEFVLDLVDDIRLIRKREWRAIAKVAEGGPGDPAMHPAMDAFVEGVAEVLKPHLDSDFCVEWDSKSFRNACLKLYLCFSVNVALPLSGRTYVAEPLRWYTWEGRNRARVQLRFQPDPPFPAEEFEITLEEQDGAWKLCRIPWETIDPAEETHWNLELLPAEQLPEPLRSELRGHYWNTFDAARVEWTGRLDEDHLLRVLIPYRGSERAIRLLVIMRADRFEVIGGPQFIGEPTEPPAPPEVEVPRHALPAPAKWRGIEDPDQLRLDTFEPLPAWRQTSDRQWRELARDLGLFLSAEQEPESKPAGERLVEAGRSAYPAIVNALLKTDWSSPRSIAQASRLNGLISKIGKGTNLGWKAVGGLVPDSAEWRQAVFFNKRVAIYWYNFWIEKFAEDEEQWQGFTASRTVR